MIGNSEATSGYLTLSQLIKWLINKKYFIVKSTPKDKGILSVSTPFFYLHPSLNQRNFKRKTTCSVIKRLEAGLS